MASAAEDRTVVLLGKTGSGKSSLANTIFGEQLFTVCHSPTSGTVLCQSEVRNLHWRRVQLVDTPGLFDTNQDSPDFKKEILKSMIKCSSGVHAFLLVLKVERFTKHELSVAEIICEQFSKEVLNHSTVVFTQGDQLDEGVTIKEWIKDNKALKRLVELCGGRCHVFDNKYWKSGDNTYRSNKYQVQELLKTIDQTVEKNGGKCYTNENLKQVQRKLKEERKAIRSSPQYAHLPEEEKDQKAEENTFSFFWPMVTALSVVGALLGFVVMRS